MDVDAQWGLNDEQTPYVVVTIATTEYELSRAEATQLRNGIEGCLNGIVYELARYVIVAGGGKKDHLAQKEGYTDSAPAICGYSRGRWEHDGTEKQWYSARPLQSEPDEHDLCTRCVAKYTRLETLATA
jgi:hypothetical protein